MVTLLLLGAAAAFTMATVLGLRRRDSESPRVVRGMLLVAAMIAAASAVGLLLLLTRGLSPIHPYAWIWVLLGLLLLSMCVGVYALSVGVGRGDP